LRDLQNGDVMDIPILCSFVLGDQADTVCDNLTKMILSQHSFNTSQKPDIFVSPLIRFFSSAFNIFPDIFDRSEFIPNDKSARDSAFFKACHSSVQRPYSIRPCEQNHSFPGAICKEKRQVGGSSVVWNGSDQVDSVFDLHKEERKFRSDVKETYRNSRILIIAKKRGHEQIVRSSGREKTGLIVQREISIRKGVSGSARNQHSGCYVITEGKIKLVGFLVVG
jgi:hypothetical protein